jgi:hypothetical protein
VTQLHVRPSARARGERPGRPPGCPPPPHSPPRGGVRHPGCPQEGRAALGGRKGLTPSGAGPVDRMGSRLSRAGCERHRGAQ